MRNEGDTIAALLRNNVKLVEEALNTTGPEESTHVELKNRMLLFKL